MTTEAEQHAKEMAALQKLERFMSAYDTAAFLWDIDEGKSLSIAASRAMQREANDTANNDEEDENSKPTLAKALSNSNGHDGKVIRMGVNKTKVLDTRTAPKKPKAFEPKDTSAKAFGAASSRVSAAQKSLASEGMSEAEFAARAKFMSEDNIDNHRSVGREVPWASGQNTPRNVAGKVKIIKDACRKSREAQTEEDPYKLNHVAESYLAKKAAESRALKEAASQNSTVAARSIATHPTASQSDVRARLPAAFSDGGLLPATRQENNVRHQLPNEWKDFQRTSLKKQKTGQLRTWNDAQNSLKVEPNKEKSSLGDKQEYARNTSIPNVDGMAQTALPQPAVAGRQKDGRSIGAETYKKHPRSEPQQWPEERNRRYRQQHRVRTRLL